MLPPALSSRGGSGLSLSFLSPFRFGRRELADGEKEREFDPRLGTLAYTPIHKYTHSQAPHTQVPHTHKHTHTHLHTHKHKETLCLVPKSPSSCFHCCHSVGYCSSVSIVSVGHV